MTFASFTIGARPMLLAGFFLLAVPLAGIAGWPVLHGKDVSGLRAA